MAGDATENILLMDEDRIIIHALWDEKWRETVSIAGEVKRPGSMTLTEAMRVSDLFFKAGGQTRTPTWTRRRSTAPTGTPRRSP
jgi:hypothetical protein